MSGKLEPGLYLVPTPIGNARDITLRALDVLSEAELLVAEDTRVARRLLQIHEIPLSNRRLTSYNDHNARSRISHILNVLESGGSVAFVSDAGSPMVSDPGYRLAEMAIRNHLPLKVLPGPSAVTTAVAYAGLPPDRFLFAGFLPHARAARRSCLADLSAVPSTLVFFESPRRLEQSLADVAEVLGPSRPVAVCREMTKAFEEVVRGRAQDIAGEFRGRSARGEITLVIGPPLPVETSTDEIRQLLEESLELMSVKDAATAVAEVCSISRKVAYSLALEIQRGSKAKPGK